MYRQETFSERGFLGTCLQVFKRPSRITTREWAESYRFLGTAESDDPGKMDCMKTPWMLYVMECLDNPAINVIVGKKSSRIGWTTTILSWKGRIMHLDPRNIGVCFPRAAGAKLYWNEFLLPFIKGTDVIKKLVTKHCRLSKLNHKFVIFDGGYIKLINLGSADEAKSSNIPYIIVEEPDGVKKDIDKQGDGMALIAERKKSVNKDWKIIFGGTPTDKEFSQVDRAYEQSNQMVYMVPCHHSNCGQFHVLDFQNLRYDVWTDKRIDEQYGIYNPETAYYLCPHCQQEWSFEEKNENVLSAINYHNKGWYAQNPEITDVYGFAFNELLSSFENSSFIKLAKLYLKAKKAYDDGHEGLMKSFVNNSEGKAYSALTTGLDITELKKRRLYYPEMVVPLEGLILTCGIDVQRGGNYAKSRFAIVVRAWGRNGNSWLVHWTEIEGNTQDYSDSVWERLSDYVLQEFPHASGSGRILRIEACAIDAGDTTDLVYQWVKDMTESIDGKKPRFYGQFGTALFATKGSRIGSSGTIVDNYEIYNEPSTMEASTEAQGRKSLAEKMGVNVYLIGTYRSHEELNRRINLTGRRDRWYHNEQSYPKYEEGLLSVRKTYESNDQRGIWKQIPGKAKEVNDCERMNLWCSHAVGIRLFTNSNWNALEQRLSASGKKSI